MNGGDAWDFYKNEIYPFKGALERWYQSNYSFLVDLKIILITAWVILRPASLMVYHIFPSLPKRHF
jgi:lipopolysaccharide/colanic/teichoic acid biosynthesis glycosyltransferase